MSEITMIATITPAEGKADRVFSLLSSVAKQVEAEEPDTLRYQLLKQKGKDVFVVLETYKNGAAVKFHAGTPHFKNMMATVQKENLFAKPLDLVQCGGAVGGFSSRSSKL